MERLIADVNFDDYESRMYFDRQLRKSGLFQRLEEMGIQKGDTVSIYDIEFDYEPYFLKKYLTNENYRV